MAAVGEDQRLRAARRSLNAGHRLIARSRRFSRAYVATIGSVSRYLPHEAAIRIENIVTRSGIEWRIDDLSPRSVILGQHTKVKLVPHIGEFCQAALFSRRMNYETGVFRWLEASAAFRYDAVIEIGANIGIYSIFLDALIKSNPRGRLRQIVSFEPALVPFMRLLANLRANDAKCVVPFRAGIAAQPGFRPFYEPRNHFTNGSLIEEFARIFSSDVTESVIATHQPADLALFFDRYERILLKIDVEGYEPSLLAAFADIISTRQPDILIEVLAGTAEALQALDYLSPYGRYLLTDEAPRREAALTADERHRDWLLTAPGMELS